jgi:hypothetical protein
MCTSMEKSGRQKKKICRCVATLPKQDGVDLLSGERETKMEHARYVALEQIQAIFRAHEHSGVRRRNVMRSFIKLAPVVILKDSISLRENTPCIYDRMVGPNVDKTLVSLRLVLRSTTTYYSISNTCSNTSSKVLTSEV